ncbi:hypothetical protein DXV76_12415 [Rhodobacteraceae bacterium CCMM004]|nr:hypothetical protein DXV76_12415 [Rhodobacteraceae bacterium CCMM004]
MTRARPVRGARLAVRKPWTASYPDPLTVRAGEALTLTGRQEMWEGHLWLWARGPDGREGWVPDTLPDAEGRAGTAYSATELTCAPGDTVTALDRTHGWVRCRAADGTEGWVPETHLAPV